MQNEQGLFGRCVTIGKAVRRTPPRNQHDVMASLPAAYLPIAKMLSLDRSAKISLGVVVHRDQRRGPATSKVTESRARHISTVNGSPSALWFCKAMASPADREGDFLDFVRQ
jgi:hypothetical protein